MIRAGISLLLLVASAVSAQANKIYHFGNTYPPGTGTSTSCPITTATLDGCAANSVSALVPSGLPTGAFQNGTPTVQYSTFFTCNTPGVGCGPQSGQNFTSGGGSRPPWNVAGVDYPVGPWTARAAMKDPTVTPVAGCALGLGTSTAVYTASITGTNMAVTATTSGTIAVGDHIFVAGGLGLPETTVTAVVTAGSSYTISPSQNVASATFTDYGNDTAANLNCTAANVTISGYDLGPTSTHGCISVTLQPQMTGIATISNTIFENDSRCNSIATTVQHGGGPYLGLIYWSSNPHGSLYAYNNKFIGHNDQPCCWASTTGGTGNGALGNTSGGTPVAVVFMYNYFEYMPGHAVAYAQGVASTPTQYFIGYNYFAGWNFDVASGHGEVFSTQGNNIAWEVFENNTILAPQRMCNCGTTVLYPSASAPSTYGYIIVDQNVIVAGNHTGGAAALTGYKYTAVLDNGTGTGSTSGNILTIKSQDTTGSNPTDGPTPGMNAGYQIGANLYSMEIIAPAPGCSPCAGVGSQWYVSESLGASYTYWPSVNLSSGTTPINYYPSTYIAVPQGMTFNWGILTSGNPAVTGTPSITVTNNYVDWTRSIGSTAVWMINGAGYTVALTPTYTANSPAIGFSAGTLPANGNTIAFSVTGGSLPSGLTANHTYTVLNSSGSTFNVAELATPTSPITVTTAGSGTQSASVGDSGHPTCPFASYFNGNVDMTTSSPLTALNGFFNGGGGSSITYKAGSWVPGGC